MKDIFFPGTCFPFALINRVMDKKEVNSLVYKKNEQKALENIIFYIDSLKNTALTFGLLSVQTFLWDANMIWPSSIPFW